MNKEKVLVTGGAGFIGSHLCERLVEDDVYDVYSLDNYSTGSSDNHVDGVNYIIGDTKDIESTVDVSPNIVYHLGEYSRVEQSFYDMDKVWEYNKIGTYSVLNFCKNRAAKLVYAGSSTKFGDGGLSRNQSPYGWTKASNTELIENFGKWYNLSYAITYFYNVYGKREIDSGKYATLVALFAKKMREELPLTVVLPGEQKRNFTHVSDVVNGLILVGNDGFGDEFGIGSPQSYSVLEVAKMFGGKIEFLPERQGNRMRADVLTEKTTSLGWSPTISIADYIEEMRGNKWRHF